MHQADIKKAARLIADECVHLSSTVGLYRISLCPDFFGGTDARDKFTIDEACAQIADLLAIAVAKGAEMERARIGAVLTERETETLTRVQKTSDEAGVHQEAAERLTAEAAALVVKAADLARLRALASNNGLLPPTAQETTTMHTASDFAPTPPRITLPAALVAFARALAVYGAQIKAAERAFDTMPDGYDDDNAHTWAPFRAAYEAIDSQAPQIARGKAWVDGLDTRKAGRRWPRAAYEALSIQEWHLHKCRHNLWWAYATPEEHAQARAEAGE